MIRKHVDLIAIALLLAAISICSQTRSAVLAGFRSSRSLGGIAHYRHYVTTQLPRISFSRL